jgi:8-oxo-dGTP pyrophosphatase MutT (NUDIX family)
MKRDVTLLFLRRQDKVLLAMKKRGFGEGKWNGVGGKVMPGESFKEAAVRECQEEIDVTPHKVTQLGEIHFYMADDPSFCNFAHVFVAAEWEGEPHETEEMSPQWFAVDAIPYEQMWADDYLWLPLVLSGKRFKASFTLDNDAVVQHDIKEVETF